jgi:hypothetical protein
MSNRSVHVGSEVRQSVVVTADGNAFALSFGDSRIRPSLQGAAGFGISPDFIASRIFPGYAR